MVASKKSTAKRSTKKAVKTTAKKSAQAAAETKAKKAVTIDRRGKTDRRATVDRREKTEQVSAERRTVQRREKVNRRRQIDPTTCERDYNTDEVEFMNAMDQYKRTSGRMFPTCSEVLEVIKSLGYTKVAVLQPETEQTKQHEAALPADQPETPVAPVALPVIDTPIPASLSPTIIG